MPAAIAIPAIATAVAGGSAAAATIVGSHKASNSAKRAQQYQAQADAAALEDARAQRAEEQRQFDAQQRQLKAQFDAQEEERLFNRRLIEEREARRAPYRAASEAALGRLGDLLGLQGGSGPARVAPAGAGAWMSPSNAGRSDLPDDEQYGRTLGAAIGMRR